MNDGSRASQCKRFIALACLVVSYGALGQTTGAPSATGGSGETPRGLDASKQNRGGGPTLNESKLSPLDAEFMGRVARHNKAQAEIGRLAQEKGGSDAVKRYGQKLAEDHEANNRELGQIAAAKGLNLEESEDQKRHVLNRRLAALSGDRFDRAFLENMIVDHQRKIREFKRHAKGKGDADVRGFAQKTIPALEEHLKMAREVQAEVKGKGTRSGSSAPTTGTTSTPTSAR